MGVNLNLIKNINKVILRGIKVDFTFLNYVSNKNMKKRLLKRKNLNRYDRFNIKDENIINGLKNIYWPGRFQILQSNPTVLFDVCHNETSILTFLDSIKKLSISGKKYLLISIQNTKDITSCIDDMQNIFDTICCTRLDNDRMMASRELASNFTDQNQIMVLCKEFQMIYLSG